MNKYKAIIAGACACGAAMMVSAAPITYVDATTNNTTLADGTTMVQGSVGYDVNVTSADDLWERRAFGNGATIFESNADGGEDAPRLRTTITGLTPGQDYEIYTYFWGAVYSGGLWRGRTSLTDDAGDLAGYNTDHFAGSSFSPMTHLSVVIDGDSDGLNPGPVTTADGSGYENGGHFTNTVLIAEGNRGLCQVSLGLQTADGSGEINVYIDDLANTSGDNRIWYDGVGYAIPEPATIGLIGFFGAGVLFVRRRFSI